MLFSELVCLTNFNNFAEKWIALKIFIQTLSLIQNFAISVGIGDLLLLKKCFMKKCELICWNVNFRKTDMQHVYINTLLRFQFIGIFRWRFMISNIEILRFNLHFYFGQLFYSILDAEIRNFYIHTQMKFWFISS